MKVLRNICLNDTIRMLDGQWQGIRLASDGNIYFFAGSHRPDLGAPFFRYVPQEEKVETLCANISLVCDEDLSRVPAQGKVHSEICELDGWLYFGTHLSDYSVAGRRAYTGAHLIGYELATGKFRDFGVIHPNYTNYSGIALDRQRRRIYFYATPFADRRKSDGPHLWRIEIDSGQKTDLGLIAPWIHRENAPGANRDLRDNTHGQSCAHMHVDGRGDCWLTLHEGDLETSTGLWVARAATGKLERFPHALPGGATRWRRLQPLDENRALVLMAGGAWLFEPPMFSLVKSIDQDLSWSSLGVGGGRFYWNCRDDKERHTTKFPVMRLFSAALANPAHTVEHGPVRDPDGRIPRGLSGIVADDHGRVYMAGRWHVLETEYATRGVDRHGNMVAAFFTVLDVSSDVLHGGR